MNNIYQAIIDEKNRTTDPFVVDVLEKLLLLVFRNKKQLDTIPETFSIENVLLSKDVVEDIFERLHINATVTFKYRYYGYTYEITIK